MSLAAAGERGGAYSLSGPAPPRGSVALRIIEERAELVRRMARDGREAGRPAAGALYEERADGYSRSTDMIRKAVLLRPPPAEPSGDGEA